MYMPLWNYNGFTRSIRQRTTNNGGFTKVLEGTQGAENIVERLKKYTEGTTLEFLTTNQYRFIIWISSI